MLLFLFHVSVKPPVLSPRAYCANAHKDNDFSDFCHYCLNRTCGSERPISFLHCFTHLFSRLFYVHFFALHVSLLIVFFNCFFLLIHFNKLVYLHYFHVTSVINFNLSRKCSFFYLSWVIFSAFYSILFYLYLLYNSRTHHFGFINICCSFIFQFSEQSMINKLYVS